MERCDLESRNIGLEVKSRAWLSKGFCKTNHNRKSRESLFLSRTRSEEQRLEVRDYVDDDSISSCRIASTQEY